MFSWNRKRKICREVLLILITSMRNSNYNNTWLSFFLSLRKDQILHWIHNKDLTGKQSVCFGDRFHPIRVDARPNRTNKTPFSNINGHTWTGLQHTEFLKF